MNLEAVPDLLVGVIDGARASGDEKLATMLESFAPLVGTFVKTAATKKNQSRAFFIADLASRMLHGALENALDSHENMAPAVRRAVALAALILDEAEKAADKDA